MTLMATNDQSAAPHLSWPRMTRKACRTTTATRYETVGDIPMTKLPPRPWLLPEFATSPGVGIWKAENTGSAEMVGAVEYAPVSELERLRAEITRREEERKLMSARIAAQRKECRVTLSWSNAVQTTFYECIAERQGLFAQIKAAEAEVAKHDERAARICEALHRQGVSPEKWPDYFRNRAAGDQLLARAALQGATK